MSRHFREDENELPYLVWEAREDKHRNRANESHLRNINIKDRPFTEFSSVINGLLLSPNQKTGLLNSVEIEPKNCTFSIQGDSDELKIKFIVRNEYLTSEISMVYNLVSCQTESYFGRYSSHDGLESLQWFKDAVHQIERENGYKYEFCHGGHDISTFGKLLINDDFKAIAMFEKEGNGDHYGYKVDFNNRKLELYHVYPFHEYYEFFFL